MFSAPRQVLLIDQKRSHEGYTLKPHDAVVVTTSASSQPTGSLPSGKVQHVVYTHGNFAPGVQYAAPNGFIQAPMNLPMNLPQGQSDILG